MLGVLPIMPFLRVFAAMAAIALGLPFLAALIFGGGGLLYAGARNARIPWTTYWTCVEVQILSSLGGALAAGAIGLLCIPLKGSPVAVLCVASLALGFGLVAKWRIIQHMLQTTFRQAVLAWLPTMSLALLWGPVLLIAAC